MCTDYFVGSHLFLIEKVIFGGFFIFFENCHENTGYYQMNYLKPEINRNSINQLQNLIYISFIDIKVPDRFPPNSTKPAYFSDIGDTTNNIQKGCLGSFEAFPIKFKLF